MKTFLRRLFAADAAPAVPTRTTLGVESLDSRLLMSVTPTLANGTLTLTGDGASDTVSVSHASRYIFGVIPVNDPANVYVRANGQTQVYATSSVRRIVFDGGAGNDTFRNSTAIGGTIQGGAGNDTLIGGTDNDVFLGSTGNDTYTGSGGQDVLQRNGNRGFFTDGGKDDTTVGLVTQKLTAAELRAEGQLNVYLSGNQLVFSGPSGAGFTMTSAGWKAVTDAKGRPGFETSQAITLNTTWGDLTLPATGTTTRIDVKATTVKGVGQFDKISVGGVPVTNSGLTNTFSDKLESFTGGDVGLPNLSWGIALGDEIGDDDAPLSSAVPYLFAQASTGYSFGYENVSVSTPNSYSGTFAFAPGDGTLYAGISGLPVVGDFGIGVSTSGSLLYTPDRIPDYVSDPNITGHFYLRGAVSLDDLGIPLGVNGEMVLDLDANDDGQLLGGVFNPTTVRAKLKTVMANMTDAEQLAALTRSALSDIAFGMNAGVDLELKAVSMKILEGSLWVKPNEVAFRGGTTDPLEGVPMAGTFSKNSLSGLDVQGYVRTTNHGTEWGLGAAAGIGFGNSGAKISLYAGSAINGFLVTGTVRLDLDGFGKVEAQVSGFFGFNGDWTLSGSFDFWGVDWDISFGVKKGKSFLTIG